MSNRPPLHSRTDKALAEALAIVKASGRSGIGPAATPNMIGSSDFLIKAPAVANGFAERRLHRFPAGI
jgi:hypothetical protein